jgi:probable HAF family extracellular repeat protein
MTDLGTLGGDDSYAYRINGTGQIVGKSQIAGDSDTHAFVVSNGKMIDLNSLIDPSLGWDLQDATGINNAGQITGDGTIDGQTHAFLLNLVLPAITSADAKTMKVGVDRTFTITATGSPAPKIREFGALPAGVTFAHMGAGMAKLSGAPAAGTSGVYTVIFRARNGVRPNTTQTFTLTVRHAPAATPSVTLAPETILGLGNDSVLGSAADVVAGILG